MQHIEIIQRVPAPVKVVFHTLCDHQQFGEIMGLSIDVVEGGAGGLSYGEGSVRRIQPPGPLPAFEETVTRFEAPQRMEYQITRGSPLSAHHGVLLFTALGDATRLQYTIRFKPRWPVPGLGFLLKSGLEFTLRRGLERWVSQLG